MATMIVTENSRKMRPRSPGMKTNGMKTAASNRQYSEGNFAGAVECSLHDRLAVLGTAHHVLQKHNRIIDKETDSERQCHESEVVDGEIEHVHHGHGKQ